MASNTVNPSSGVLSAIDYTLVLVSAEIAHLEILRPMYRDNVPRESPNTDSNRLEELELFAQRLRQIKQWLLQDPSLLVVVDEHLNQHTRKVAQHLARQNTWLTLMTSLGGIIIGWLLSGLVTPIQVLHAFIQ